MLIGQAVDDVEMMPARIVDELGVGTESGPDIGEQFALPEELRAFVAADPAGHMGGGNRQEQSGAFPRGFAICVKQLGTHAGPFQRPEIMQPAD